MQQWLKYTMWRPLAAIMLAVFLFSHPDVEAKDSKELHTARYFASRAQQFEDNGAWEAAKREIDYGLELYPDDPDLRYLNGRYYYYAQQDLNQARYNLVKALQEEDQHFLSRRLLVDVEEDAGHFSSAICYINELLEFEPYDRDLWRRKITLYNRIGHTVEADQALERLARIYPNDSIVMYELAMRNRETWNQMVQSNSMSETAANLEHYIEHDPTNLDYYYKLIDIYKKMGENERALGTVNMGLYYYPHDQELVRLGSNLLTGIGEYVRALNFLRENRVGGSLYNNVLQEVAADDRIRDPYEANGILYARTKNKVALDYMLNTSLTRGYYDDAKYYLNEAMKMYGVTTPLLMKEYTLERRFGTKASQRRLLQQLFSMNPEDEEIRDQYIDMMLELTNSDVESEQWSDALTHIRRAIELMDTDSPQWAPSISRQIYIMGRLGMLNEARWVYEHASKINPQERDRFAAAYEEVAAVKLKDLIENEQYVEALELAESLQRVLPTSETALRACINLSQTLMRKPQFWHYAEEGYKAFPDNPYFIVKQAVALQEQGKVAEALALLKTTNQDDHYMNSQLSTAYQGIAAEEIQVLLKEHRAKEALELADRALEHNPDNKELLYAKGLAYEQLKDYALAYEYQSRNYNPSNAEQAEWYQHMKYLRFRGYKNRIDASYTYAVYDTRSGELGSVAHMYSIATVAYSRLTARNTYTFQASYKGIDGYILDNYFDTGGIGIELGFTWEHAFNQRWSMILGGSWSNQYFNRFGATAGLGFYAGRGWTLGLKAGYRRTPPTMFYFAGDDAVMRETREYNLYILSPSVEKAWERIRMTVGADITKLRDDIYYNVNWKGKLFVNEDGISSVGLTASYGTFPELTFFDQSALNNSARNNASVGFDAQYLVTKNMYLGLTGVWNTFYNPINTEYGILRTYRNVYVLTGQLHVAF